MPLPAPKPVDALRQHTRAVVLTSADGSVSPLLLDAIQDSGIACELIGHPLVAMAELVRLEQHSEQRSPSGSDGGESTALVIADQERLEDLSTLFDSVMLRLPQVSIWIIAGDIAIEVQRGRPPETSATPTPSGTPRLRIAGEPASEPKPPVARAASSDESVTAAELEMLLDFNEEDHRRGDRDGGRR